MILGGLTLLWVDETYPGRTRNRWILPPPRPVAGLR